MAIQFIVQDRKVSVRVAGRPSLAERIHASNVLLTYAAPRYRFPQNPNLRAGKKRFRDERLLDVERELQNNDLLGLEVLAEPQFSILGPGWFYWYRPDWELLNWWGSEYRVEIIDGRAMELPIGIDGRRRAFLTAPHVRCLASWSQSKLEKHAFECPGLLKKPGQFGVRWAVETVEFLKHFGDPKFPFLPPPWRPHDTYRRAA